MRVRVFPYSSRSLSARSVAKEMNGLTLKREGSQYQYRTGDVIINWGCYGVPSTLPVSFNQPSAVRIVCSKVRTYQALASAGVPTVEWTTSHVEARNWLNSGFTVFHRAVDSGARGVGITVLSPDSIYETLPSGGFFTKRIAARREFRVYCVRDQVTTILEKRQRLGVDANPHVRSYENGYVFCRNHRSPVDVDSFTQTSLAALQAVGLDFGGIDVLLKDNGAINVLEINSAPGITGTAIKELCVAFKRLSNIRE